MAFLFGKELSRKEIMQRVGDISQIGGVKKYTLNGGKTEGVTAFEINTGAGLKFNLLPERAMDIAWADYKGTPLSWISKTGVTAPQYFEHKGLEWLRGFYGGVLTTCGLRQTGAPSTCDGEDFALHGRIANTPADNVSVNEYWQGDDFIMTVSGQMRESIVFGENLLLKREITTKLGDNKFVIKDTLINEGFKTEGVLVLYHMNFGFPLIDDGATIQMPKCEMIPATEVARRGLATAMNLHAPVNNCEEQCFFMDFVGENKIEVGINNDKLDGFKGVYIKYNKKQLPWFTIWKMLGESDYVVGLEPGTAFPMGREKAKNEGYLTMLKPFEEYSIEIEFGIKE